MGFIHANGTTLERDGKPVLLRGFGLGGWLLPEGYMWKLPSPCDRPRRIEALVTRLCGPEYAQTFWQNYLNRYITESDIEWIAAEGFNCVRLPINARHLRDGQAWPYIDACVQWGKQYGVFVMLDMHGAPGGQTGQNIDDCEHDQPELFQNPAFQEELIGCWQALARRYRDEERIAGYDLLNEPLPNFFSQYNNLLLPLYRRLAAAIRQIDTRHLLVAEGLHWATDFSVFNPLREEPLDDNLMLQFHKYWSEPDEESIRPFLTCAEPLNLPLFAGESGENNLDWYAAAFPMYERRNVGWSFWSYKKMACDNSPVTFAQPEGWAKIQACATGGTLPREEATRIFDAFLASLQNATRNHAVLRALTRRAPLRLPAEHFDACEGHSPRQGTAEYRMDEPVRIVFANGRTGKVHFDCNAGQPQPPDENLQVLLASGESVRYRFTADGPCAVTALCRGEGTLCLRVNSQSCRFPLTPDWQTLGLTALPADGKLEVSLACDSGEVTLEEIAAEPACKAAP